MLQATSPVSSSQMFDQDSIFLNGEEFLYLKKKFFRECVICQTVKPPRTHHCSKCGRCVMRMDHHCYWVSNCIGLKNMKFFLQYLFFLWITLTFQITTTLTFGVACLKDHLDLSNPTETKACESVSLSNSLFDKIALWSSLVLSSFAGLFAFTMFIK